MPANNGGMAVWSKTAAANASADTTVNWQEGQAPSSINDSARNLMASVAKYRDDIAGAIVTSGTSAAYTVASNQNFVNLTDFAGQVIAFTPHVTNAAGPVTMTVDGFANLPVRTAPNAELMPGVLIAGTPYTATYNNTDHALYLHGFYGNPFNVPLGAGMDYWFPTTPNSAFAFPAGQAISRTTYAAFFAAVGTTYGAGDGTTTFNLPDKRGRVSACPDVMAGSTDPNRLSSGALASVRNSIGGAGGESAHTQTVNEIAAHFHNAGISDPGHSHSTNALTFANAAGTNVGSAFSPPYNPSTATISGAATGVRVASSNGLDTTYSAGGGAAMNVMQPTILCNYIIRVL